MSHLTFSCLSILAVNKYRVNWFVEIELTDHALLLDIEDSNIAVHAWYEQVALGDSESSHGSSYPLVFGCWCPVLATIQLEDLADTVSHVASMIAAIHG